MCAWTVDHAFFEEYMQVRDSVAVACVGINVGVACTGRRSKSGGAWGRTHRKQKETGDEARELAVYLGHSATERV